MKLPIKHRLKMYALFLFGWRTIRYRKPWRYGKALPILKKEGCVYAAGSGYEFTEFTIGEAWNYQFNITKK